jgi:hypothetical protein
VGTIVILKSGLLAIVVEPGKTNILLPLVRVVYDSIKHRFVKPYDLDLEKTCVAKSEDRIVGYENPARLGINPLDFLNLHGTH